MKRLLLFTLRAGWSGLGILGVEAAARSACRGCCTSSSDLPNSSLLLTLKIQAGVQEDCFPALI